MEDWELKMHEIPNEENNIAGTSFSISLKVRKWCHFPMTNLLNLNLSGCGKTGRNCNKGINKKPFDYQSFILWMSSFIDESICTMYLIVIMSTKKTKGKSYKLQASKTTCGDQSCSLQHVICL